ncbi:MAG: hypothetical protein HPY69_00095 [Armatimonadetes bacterium]|nr:hypothetical protein [Armatimonadota bacterium]
MPWSGLRGERDTTERVQRALYIRCRRGESEALAALLYSLVDRLYTAASYVLPDETSAITTVAETWHDLMESLRGAWGTRNLLVRAMHLLGQRLKTMAPDDQVDRALRRARTEDDGGLLSFPDGDLQVLLDAVPLQALHIAESAGRRRMRFRQAVAFAVLFVAFVVGHNIWRQGTARRSAETLKLTALQAEVQRDQLITAVRDCVDELPDPEGADRYEARVLQQLGLVLEELANTQAAQGAQTLALLSRRVRQERLTEDLTEVMSQREGMARKELSRALLVLEEVANL